MLKVFDDTVLDVAVLCFSTLPVILYSEMIIILRKVVLLPFSDEMVG
jgi:hypothetical protein